MRKAIVSVSDKQDLIPFVKVLIDNDYEIYSTGGTLKLLEENNIPAQSIKSLTQFPEILDGRVKTLHPHIHGGILADKHNKKHVETCEEHSIALIDLVVVNLYPFESTIKRKDATFNEIIESIDIGGPTLIRAAAKNFESIGVLVSPDSYEEAAEEIKKSGGLLSKETRKQLATVAFKHIAKYDIAIANYFDSELSNNKETLPSLILPTLEKVEDLRYGENPHQKAALYQSANGQETTLKQLHGKQLSYNNFLDINAAVSIVKSFDLPGAAIIKHTNPCGAAVGETILDAYKSAHETDPQSAFGSIVGLNRVIDIDVAEELNKTFIEVIVAPKFEEEAVKLLSKKSSLRLIEIPMEADSEEDLYVQPVGDGKFLVQTIDALKITPTLFNCVTEVSPTQKQMNDLVFAFSLVKHVKSNAILVAKDGHTLGIGAGQMSRVDSVDIALEKSGKQAEGAVLASDAFFPFKDSVELCNKYGIKAIVQPGGSKRDQESIDACNEHGIAMVFTGSRHFKH